MGTQPIFQYGYWLLNNSLPALKDKNVRQAFAHLVDYNEILQNVYQGMASQAIGPISPMKPYYHKELKPYTYSLDKANTLLDAAGWKDTDGDGIRDKVLNGKKTKLSFKLLSSNAAEVAKRTAELIRDNSRKAGVEFVIDAKDINAITKETRAGAYETAILAAATMPGADDLYQFFHSASLAPKGENRSMYASPAADALIEQIRSNPDPISRTAQYLQLQAQLFEDVPVVFLFVPKHRYVVSNPFQPCMPAQRPRYYEPFFQLK